jgi:predicted metalloprotease with PDZ domain
MKQLRFKLMIVMVACAIAATSVLGQQPKSVAAKTEGVPVFLPEGRNSKLGIVAKTEVNGARILYVVKDTPAYHAGLEAGDVILSVDGFPVGLIDGVEYPVQSEIRRVKGTGIFKIRDFRTQEIVTKKIQLGPDSKGGEGDGPPKDPDDTGPKH